MKMPLIESKLMKPEQPSDFVHRQLIAKGNDYKFILVSATAGSGKSLLVSSYLDQIEQPYIWYGLDAWDNDIILFLTYLVEGIRKVNVSLGALAKEYLDAYQNLGLEGFARGFIALLENMEEGLYLILDDYHLIENQEIDKLIQMLLDHTSSKVRLILIGRQDPNLAWSRLRVNQGILELRTKDLKFSQAQQTAFVASHGIIHLDEKQSDQLYGKTEGWIAGLKLSVMNMAQLENPEVFLDELSAQEGYVFDYLLEEVLKRLSQQEKSFLIKVSITNYFNAELCQAITGDSDAPRYLAQFLKHNMFIVSSKEQTGWYRFHHLFRKILNTFLQESLSINEIQHLHRQAGRWLEEHGFHREALEHFLECQDYEAAASIVECLWSVMDLELMSGSWLTMAKRLPEKIFQRHPVLAMGYGWALLDNNYVEDAINWLNYAEELHENSLNHPDQYKIVDEVQYTLMGVNILSARGYIAAATGDIENLFKYANAALDQMIEGHSHKRAVIAMLLSFAHWSLGHLKEAESVILSCLEDVKKEVNKLTYNSFYMVLIEFYIQQGLLVKAEKLIDESLYRIIHVDNIKLLLPSLHLAKAKLLFLKGMNQEAQEALDKSRQYGDQMALMDYEYKYYLMKTRLYLSQNLKVSAKDSLLEAKSHYFMNPIPEDISIELLETMLYDKNRQLQSVSTFSYMTIPATFHQLHLAILKGKDPLQTKEILDVLQEHIDESGNHYYAIEYALLRLLFHQQDQKLADKYLDQAVELSQQNGVMRPFLTYLDSKTYEHVFEENNAEMTIEHANEKLAEPLTIRELEVLQLIVDGLSNKEIADRLFLALSTVKGYIQNIYGKMEVKRRTEAVREAKRIGLTK